MTARPSAVLLACGSLAVAGCAGGAARTPAASAPPATLTAAARPIATNAPLPGRARAPAPATCRPRLGRRFAAHVEVFADDRVVLVPAGVGVGRPFALALGRVEHARCFGPLVTLDPTGVVLVAAGTRASLRDVLAAWGVPLGPRSAVGRRLRTSGASRAYVGGRRWTGDPLAIPLRRHAEIVLELGPRVPPHASYRFPRGL
jgi:hypothetical protein